MKINNYYIPNSMEEAYKLVEKDGGTIIGGGAFLHLGKRNIDSAVDISKLGLDFIKETEGFIEIGAAATLREIEKSDLLNKYFDGILSKTAAVIMGVQIRNMATIGGTLSGKYGFSDLLTSLLSLDTRLAFYKKGEISLEEHLKVSIENDILTKVKIKKEERKAKYLNFRNTSTDFSILNVAVSKCNNYYRIAVGARPAASNLALDAMEYVNKEGVNIENAKKAGELAAENLNFGSDIRSSEKYRMELCQVLVKRALLEVEK